MKKIFLIAGESSADHHAACLIRELKKTTEVQTFGVGGKRLEKEGMELVVDASSLNVMGIADWLDKFGEVLSSYRKVSALIDERKPDLAILLDLPDVNLRMAKKLKARGVPVVYYVSPQVWAWRKYRLKTIQKYVDKMLVLFPFEKDFYLKNGVQAEFVGDPLLDTLEARTAYRSQSEIQESPRIALLPGSRRSELRYHGPVVSELARRLARRYPTARFSLPVALTLDAKQVADVIDEPRIEITDAPAEEVLKWADIAAVASGTATLETALIGTPFALFYKVASSSAWIYRNVVRYKGFIGMPNLLHGKEVFREFFQEEANSETLYYECVRLLEDPAYRETMASELLDCRNKLGQRGASERAAFEVTRVLS